MFIPSFQLGVQLASSNTLQSFPLALRQSLLGLEAGADMDQWTAMESPALGCGLFEERNQGDPMAKMCDPF